MNPIDRDLATVTRRMIVQYSGVVQDFNPVHYDEEFARKSGLPSVIAQGSLTATVILDGLVAQGLGDEISRLSIRLKAPVVPGNALHLACDAQGGLSIKAAGRELLTGSVELKDA